MEPSTIIGLILGLLVLTFIVVGIYYFYKYIQRQREQEERDRDAPNNPDTVYCVTTVLKSFIPPNQSFPIILSINIPHISNTSTCEKQANVIGFRAYDRPIPGTSPWCVYTTPFPGDNGLNYLVSNRDTCATQVMVMYLPATQDFSTGLVPLYMYSYTITNIPMTYIGFKKPTFTGARELGKAYVFPLLS